MPAAMAIMPLSVQPQFPKLSSVSDGGSTLPSLTSCNSEDF